MEIDTMYSTLDLEQINKMSYEEFFNLTGIEPRFSFITDYRPKASLKWVKQNWTITFYFMIVYLAVIFSIKHLMRNRKQFELKLPLTLWNAALTVFSMLGTYHTLPDLTKTVVNESFYSSACIATRNAHIQYYIWLFALSKVFEFGDTLFIVLRKRQLIPLHYIHHCFTLVFTWYAYGHNISLGRWFVTMNYSVHSLMYLYYTLRAQNVKISRWISMTLTTLQILQMVLGIACCVRVLWSNLISRTHCECDSLVAFAGLLLYSTFFYMFSNFFYNAYLKNAQFSLRIIQNRKQLDEHTTSVLNLVDKCMVDDNNNDKLNDKLTNNGLARRKSRKSITNYTRLINTVNGPF